MMDKARRLNIHYAAINALYLAMVCGTMGFAANYLLSKDMTNATVGLTLTVVSIVGAVFQTVFAPIIDRSDKITEKTFILATLAVEVIGSVLLLLLGNGALLIPVVVVTYASAALGMPFLNTVAFLYEKEGITINYGVSRGIGSAAYAVAGWVFGQLLMAFSPSALPWFYIVLGALTFAAVFTLPNPAPAAQPATGAATPSGASDAGARSLSYPQFFSKYTTLTLVCLGMVGLYFCHMIINNFMVNVVAAIVGADVAAGYQGTAVFIQAMVELPTMFLFSQILKRVNVKTIMVFAVVMYSIKHLVVLLSVMTTSMPLYYVAMVLQMLSYAVVVPASVYFVNEVCEKADLNKGQSVMSLSTTIGGLFASLIGGALFDVMPVAGVLAAGVVASVAGTAFVVMACLRKK